MRIRTKKKMRLDELIKYVWENPTFEKRVFLGSDYQRVVFDNAGGFYPSGYCFSINSLFTVEVEEELTEDTLFREVIIVVKNDDGHSTTYTAYDETLKDAVNKRPKIYKVYGFVNDSLYLIWRKDTGIPESGVLEADVE